MQAFLYIRQGKTRGSIRITFGKHKQKPDIYNYTNQNGDEPTLRFSVGVMQANSGVSGALELVRTVMMDIQTYL